MTDELKGTPIPDGSRNAGKKSSFNGQNFEVDSLSCNQVLECGFGNGRGSGEKPKGLTLHLGNISNAFVSLTSKGATQWMRKLELKSRV